MIHTEYKFPNRWQWQSLKKADIAELIKDRVIQLKHETPTRTLQSIGDEVGVTRERVRQILKAEGLNNTYPPREYQSKRANLHNDCKTCGIELDIKAYHSRRVAECIPCRQITKDKALYTHITCPHCNFEFKISKAYLATRQRLADRYHATYGKGNTSDRPFCSRKCSALYHKAGISYGFGASEHASNIKTQRPKLSEAHTQRILKARANGMIYKEIARLFETEYGISVTEDTLRRYVKRAKAKAILEKELIEV